MRSNEEVILSVSDAAPKAVQIGDCCGEAPIFFYPALGNLNINLQLPISLVSHLSYLSSTH